MGRPPTSGNCHTCRQRRVKCDKARPACDRCARGGFVCQGYEAVLRIQNHAAVSGAVPGSVRLAKVQDFSSYPGAETKAKKLQLRTAALRAAPSQAAQSQPSKPASPPESAESTASTQPTQPTPLVPQPSLVGFVDDMATSYFFQSYGWINMHSILLQDAAMQRHFLQPDSNGNNGNINQDSLRALCYGLFGRDKQIPALQDAGRRVYGRAIAQLRATITTSSKDELAALAKPISLLGSYSVAVERDLRFTHHTGLARILEVCGPEYFQSPDMLPIFESVRMTLVADAVVRRQPTFLAQPQWKTLPWAGGAGSSSSSAAKSATSRLLDIIAAIPAIIQGVWGVMGDRVQWLAGGGHEGYCEVPRLEHPDAVAQLQARVLHEIRKPAAAWHREWTASSELAPRVLAWAYARGGGGDDTYRPGLFGVHGPDPFDILVDGISSTDDLSFSPAQVGTLMQDAALYTTLLVWAARLDRYLARAAQSMSCVDFLTKPFRTSCTCSSALQCETVPPVSDGDLMERSMAWNVSTCVAVGPVRFGSLPDEEASASPHALKGDSLLPGDIRFVAHMRILSWLSRRLPATRGAMLATLAAVGLAHCAHDVRPAEGHSELAAVAVVRVLDSTGVDGAADILLKRYQHVGVSSSPNDDLYST